MTIRIKTDSGELLEGYRRKDLVENSFDDLKNTLDMNRLSIHSSATMDNRLFIQFIALILISRIRSIAAVSKQNKGMRFMPVREIMEAIACIVRITYPERYGCTVSEIAPLQQDIITAFDLKLEL